MSNSLFYTGILVLLCAHVQASAVQRQGDTESITFPVIVSPTQTSAPVASAYGVYAETCGSDLDSVAYAALPDYIQTGGPSDTTILDEGFQDFLGNNSQWIAAKATCASALNGFESVLGVAEGPTITPSGSASSPLSTALPTSSGSTNSAGSTSAASLMSTTSSGSLPSQGTFSNRTSTSSSAPQSPSSTGSAVGRKAPIWGFLVVLSAAVTVYA
ncbi:hypothetical protein C8F04DRAFT_1196287 [Mycena alexandri]|uniref:Uncharacterized protein n=1 Tax=Mycena alexandri TaxID=1745969 RepID=A0AAD6WR94_9AGAR|nr:hypothetical protein C8F04DRAFT_1196287 [Mycena alexandri]